MANEYDKLLAPAASDNPYDAMLGGERKQTMRVNMMTGVDANPDTEARVQDFARRYNLPAEAVRLELPQIERRAKVEALDYDTLARMPATAKLLENPDKARLVHDDVQNLQAAEDLFWKRYGTGQAAHGKIDGPAYQRGDWQVPQPTATARAASFVANTGSAMASSVPKFNEGAWGLLRAGGDLLPDAVGDPVAGFAARMGGVSRGQGERLMPKASGLVEASWYSGMQSFGLNMLQMPLAFAGGGAPLAGTIGAQVMPRMSPVLASMGLTTGGQAYGEARDKGVGVGQSLAFGASQGVIEAGTEMIGMPALFSLLKPGKFVAKSLEYLVKEQGGEQLATALQDLNEWGVLPENKDNTVVDYLAERPSAALQTALSVVFGGGAQVATMKGVGWAMNRAEHQQYKAQQAEASAALMGQLNELAKASKVLQRDPATFEEFIAEASAESPVNTVYIDGQALMQSGMGEMLMQVSPSVAAQLPEAAQTGGTVAIPVSEYAARIAPTEHAQGLQDLIRTEPDGFSRAEAQDYMATQGEQLQQEVERAAAEAENADAFRASADAVRETIKTQLTQAGVFREAVNDAYAAVPASFYAVTAAKLGMTPEQLYEQYPLTVGAQLPTQGAVFNQGEGLDALRAQWDAAGLDHAVSEANGIITLSKIVVPESARGAGAGTQAMQALVDYADRTGQHIALTPSDDFGGNKKRLTEFYKRFGFVENKGKNRAFSTRESMYRQAPGRVLHQSALTPTQTDTPEFKRWFSPSPRDVVAGLPKSVINGLETHSKAIADFLESEAVTSHRGGIFNIPRPVLLHMVEMVSNNKILDAVVGSIPIDVVNFLGRKERSAKDVLHDVTVLENVLSVDPESDVSLGVDPSGLPLLTVRVIANAGAKISGLTGGPFERNAAILADANDPVLGAHVRSSGNKDLSILRGFGGSKVVDADGKPLVVYHGTGGGFTSFSTEKLGSNTGAASARRGFFFASNPKVSDFYSKMAFEDLTAPVRAEWDQVHKDRPAGGKWVGGYEGDFVLESDPSAGQAYKERVLRARSAFLRLGETEKEYRKLDRRKSEISHEVLSDYGIHIADAINVDASFLDENPYFAELMREYVEVERAWNEIRMEFGYMHGANVMPVYLKILNPLVHDFRGERYRDVTYNELIKQAQDQGHDGVILKNTFDTSDHPKDRPMTDVYVAFRPEQIKSAIGNRGTFDPDNKSILLQGAHMGEPTHGYLDGEPYNPPTEQLSAEQRKLIVDTFNANTSGEKVTTTGEVESSGDIGAKSRAFQALAQAEGWHIAPGTEGNKYFVVGSKPFLPSRRWPHDAITIPVRVSDHSNVNRGAHFKESAINLAPDDGYAFDEFESALWKLRNAGEDEEGNLTFGGEEPNYFQGNQAPGRVRHQSAQAPRGAYNPSTLNIALLKGADLSTFLHETGHHFLEMQLNLSAQLAAKPALTEGEQSLVSDSNALLKWFGVRDLAEWQNMPFEERRAHHETFARGFEAYLYEGQAPSIELQGLFQRFRAWLIDVYKGLKKLNVELTPDVRGVMDRMLATTDEIVMAEQARGMMPSFETAEQAGMTQAEWAEYQRQHTQATQDAAQDLQARGLRDMQWLANARGREVARLKRESAALRKQAEMQARRELMNEPVYRAWAFLTGKITEEDRLPKPPAPPKTGTALNPEVDSLLPAIAKLGGIARASAGEHLGVHKDDFRVKSGVFGATVFRAEGGLSADAMAERLVEQGYLTPDDQGRADLHQLEDKIGAELIGDNQYSVHHDWANAYGEMRAGEQAANLSQLGAGRLDVGALQEMYGKSGGENVDWARLTERRMTSDNGLHPDVVAELLTDDAGAPMFSSGDHLVHALLEAQPLPEAVRELTDARMLQEHGELASPEAIAVAADAAIHNAARARFVATEANALAKATGAPKVLNEAARAYAEQVIARHKLRDLKPSRYTNAETKAAKAAAKAMKAGDLALAAAEKRNQLIQSHLARAAHQAREQGAKDVRYLRKFDKRSPSLDAEYADQIDALLDRYDLRDRSLRAIDRAKSLRQWYDEQVARGLEPDIPQSLLDEAAAKSWKDMTVEEFRGVVDTVRQIEHLGRLKHRLLTAQDKRAFDAIATDVAQTIRDNGGAVRPKPLERERGLGGLVRQFRAGHRKFASLLRQMDGSQDNGLLWNLLGREMNDRGTQEAVANERATEALMALYKPMLKLKGGLTGEKVFIPAIGDSLTRGGRLAVALNWGNADNRQRLMSGRGWNEAQVSAVLGTLSREELGFVNGVWEYLDSFWPEIAAKEKRLTGVEPERVQAAPFTLALASGEQVDMRGGYYPIKYDPTQSDRAAAQDAAQIADEMKRGAFTRATTRRGHTKARTAEVKGRPLLLDLSVITQHVSQVNHDLAWHEWLVDANRLLADRRITSAIRDHYGHETLATMKNHLEAIATGDLQTQDAIDRAMLYLRGAVSRSTMGLSLTTALMQPFGITQSMVRIGPKWVIQGMGRWVGDAAHFENSMTWIAEKSDFMRLRNKTFNRELSEINSRVTHGKGKLRTMADASLFYLMQKMQLVADVPTWIGAYEKAQAAGHDEAKSVALADQAVIDSQGGGQTKDLSAVQRAHPFLAMFYSYFSATYNLAAESTAKTDFRQPAAVAGWMGDMALLMVIPALAPNLLMAMLRGEGGDDEWWDELPKTLAKWQAGYLLSTMVGVREVSGLIEGFAYSGPPAGRVLVDAGKLVTQVKQGEIDEGLAAASVRLLGSTTGIPSTQIVRSARGWGAWADGEAPVTSVLVGPPPPNR